MPDRGRVKAWGQIALLAAAMFGAVYLYKLWPTHEARAWWQYRFTGAQDVVLWLAVWALLRPPAGLLRWVTALVCAWGSFQSFETVACSFTEAVPVAGSGLCTAQFGPWFNVTLAAAGGATLLLWRAFDGPDSAARGGLRRIVLGLAARCRRLGSAARTATIRAAQAVCYYFRVR